MKGVVVDGNNVLEMYGVACPPPSNEHGPAKGRALIEAKTYRYYAHTSDDDDKLYRTREEVELWRRKDPIPNFRQYLVEQRVLTEARRGETREPRSSRIITTPSRSRGGSGPDGPDRPRVRELPSCRQRPSNIG